MANTYLSRTNTSPTSANKCTFSAWVKRSKLGERQRLMTVINPSSTGAYYFVEFTASDNLGVNDYDGVSSGGIGGSTSRKFRDVNAWYHIVVAYDTTQATGTNRIKVYVNGDEAEFNFDATGDQNRTLSASVSGKTQFIGYHGTSSMYYNGAMSHVHFVDGLTLTASTFGSTDSTTGEWKINTSPTVSNYGNNGFFILKDTNSGTDQSGKSNNLTASGTLTKTEDNPSNVFATLNPLKNNGSMGSFSHGNLTYSSPSNVWRTALSTLGITSGKFYYEAKWVSGSHFKVGFAKDTSHECAHIAETAYEAGYAWYQNSHGEVRTDSAVISGWAGSDITNITNISTGDIMKIAIDMDNKFAYFGVNNVWAKNADPTSGSSGTGGLDISSEYPAGSTLMPGMSVYNATGSINFGNGYFGTTAVSSAGTNASNLGIFEYDVPTGYTALCTKGLNE